MKKKIAITSEQLQPLKNSFKGIKRLDPLSDHAKALELAISSFTDQTLKNIIDENIKFLSAMAWFELHRRGVSYAL